MKLVHRLYCLNRLFHQLVSTLWCRLFAWGWSVKIGRQCRFFGAARFHKLPGSVIEIGPGCIFNSSPGSNLIGINRPCMISTISSGARIEIGANCGFSGVVIGAEKEIVIGNNVRIGANTTITDTDWHSDDLRTGAPQTVNIGDRVWIGTGVLVLKGARIGENSVIGAGSIVTGDIPANCIAAGSPARPIRQLPQLGFFQSETGVGNSVLGPIGSSGR